MYLIFDTETTGLPKDWNAPITDVDNWPRCIQIAWQLHDEMGNLVEHQDYLVKPDGFDIPYDSERIHGISTDLATEKGVPLKQVLDLFYEALGKAKFIVGQNLGFDIKIMGAEFYRMKYANNLAEMSVLDTCTEVTAELLKLPGGRGGRYKLPTLTELHQYLFGVPFGEAHNATADVEATTRCFFELIRKEIFTKKELQVEDDYFVRFAEANPTNIQPVGLNHINLKKASEEIAKLKAKNEPKIDVPEISDEVKTQFAQAKFAHLHNHSQFSILQSTISVDALVAAAAKDKMPAVAITDHGNMMAAFHFNAAVQNHNKEAKAKNEELIAEGKEPTEQIIKPIIGSEFFVCEDHTNKSQKDNGYQIVLLAKNKNGYQNLVKLASIAYTDGFYYVPRIDKKLIEQYKEDILVLSGNLQGEVPNKILNLGERQAEEALIWWKEQFGDDFYIEMMRHNQEDENRVNQTLLTLARKHEVKLIATNNTYYISQDDSNAHDILLCVRDAEKQATPIGRGRGFRFGLPNQEYYFKSQDQMKQLFQDVPDSIINIQEVVDKIEEYTLYRDVLLPKFDIPDEFQSPEDEIDGGKRGENAYLRHLTYEGAKKRYPEITDDIRERLDFELLTIEKTGYPGYFLIVQDFIAAARKMGVSVGPGRGSAAGSAVAYCLWITNLDPIQYDLLFERFLNPDRVSMPDIDIDFDDEGRSLVMDYVIDKYGASQVAQIITYGTMAAKSSIKDTARVLDLPLYESERVAKLIPNMKLAKIFKLDDKALKDSLRSEELEAVNELKRLSDGTDLIAETIQQAKILEGSVRNTGIHACGVIITPDDITNYVPVTTAKDSDLYVTQFDNSVAESAGLLKMDFLGLKTLTLIKDTIKLVKMRHNIEIDPDTIPIDDAKTYELFQRGETIGVFQYESPGMQKYMRDLKPTVFADLIAMNALYRPGPLEYIPSFVRRKNGEEPIKYDLDACEEYLGETYGITVYQEQVMLLSQKLADFSKGDADVLRKAMGKKQKAVLDKMKPKFVNQAAEKGHDPKVLEKIWTDWEAFASYAFNKSHSTCYAWIAYQTAYLKAHYPAEYMAAVLSNNMNDIKQVTFFMEECKRMGLSVLGPDINESITKFNVNELGEVRFGMGGVKGVGQAAVQSIIKERTENGPFKDIYDFVKRVELRTVNKKTIENLVLAGGFDSFEFHRGRYFFIDNGTTNLEKLIKYGGNYQEQKNSAQTSLFGSFGGEDGEVEDVIPMLPDCEKWNMIQTLAKEKEVVGIYISAHPLDDFKHEMRLVSNMTIADLKGNEDNLVGRDISMVGMMSNIAHRISKNGNEFGSFTFSDYTDSYDITLFGEEYLMYKHFMQENMFLNLRMAITKREFKDKDGNVTSSRIFTKINKLQLLTEIIEKLVDRITLNIDVDIFNDSILAKLSEIFYKYQGEKSLRIKIIDNKEQQQIDLPAQKIRVNICRELLNELEQNTDIKFKLN
ncbi:DNA polymerase III subunit alpha [Faecalibacter macacae]|uniref:DNA polymerase III subunit alpha n=1 Tax=Faecalibacter macacae TaxID=1859289 RepID=A0A3L9MHS9_9FLAO|nr:DNA polymerase III subunit alpha [Faecalibacter macacae]RLZ12630.1 DNA polymerase III subunit alpha [Faecalibacter macacae]